MRILIINLLIFINFILESTIFQYIRIFGIKPDFTIILITSYSIMRGSGYGTFIGLVSGILQDMFYGQTIGINAFAYMITGYIIGQSKENVFKDSYIPSIVFNVAAIFIYQHLFFLVTYFTKTGISYTHAILNIIFPQSIYNAILGPLAYRLLLKLDEKRFMDNKIYWFRW
ncbi:MAG: rod shape-determining protein MreD [Clostridiales bacterium]|nr:rod shape-determining protein MreD [Clostridiales bacterium]